MPGRKTDDREGDGRKLKRRSRATSAISVTPTQRLDAMTWERIDALEADKRKLEARVARLSKLIPANARLREALANAETNNLFATVAIGVGGFLVSYATFTGRAATLWANVAAGILLAGIGLMLWQSLARRLHRRSVRKDGRSRGPRS